jgi:hypothetical protein
MSMAGKRLEAAKHWGDYFQPTRDSQVPPERSEFEVRRTTHQ